MSLESRHFDATQWADYVRNLAPVLQSNEMRAHLEAGCTKCNKINILFGKFAAVSTAGMVYNIPTEIERSVKAFFSAHKQITPSLKRVLATLAYSSLNDPLPAGVRGGHQISRHALYQAGDYSLDLRFEHEQGSANMVLVGQIVNRHAPEDPMAHLAVILFSGKSELTRSLSNSYGEFQMEYAPHSNLRLLVPLESKGQELELVLGNGAQAA